MLDVYQIITIVLYGIVIAAQSGLFIALFQKNAVFCFLRIGKPIFLMSKVIIVYKICIKSIVYNKKVILYRKNFF